jgi:tetratricopeptide (TPR) repeat protein
MVLRYLTCSPLVVTLFVVYAIAQPAAAGSNAVDVEIQQGEVAIRQGRYAEAKQHFELAERMGGLNSAEINAGIAIAELQMDHYEAARQRESKVLELVSTDLQRAQAYDIIGTAWLRESAQSTASADELRSAGQCFEQAVKLEPAFDRAYFNLGDTLLRQNREEDAAAAFKNFIAAAAKNPAYEQDLPVTPRAPAPAFTINDSEGRAISSDSLRGRYVLLDFWATWCGPCIRALPMVRALARYFPPDQFALISVDEDSPDQDVWRRFIAQQKMDWTQVWDKEAQLYHDFGLAPRPDLSIPRYVLIGKDGFVRRVYDGLDPLGLVAGQIARIVAPAPQPPQVPARPPSLAVPAGPGR